MGQSSGGAEGCVLQDSHRDIVTDKTAADDVFGSGLGNLQALHIDNSLNSVPCFTKVAFAATITPGTTAADLQLRTDAGKAQTHTVADGRGINGADDGTGTDSDNISFFTVVGREKSNLTSPTNAVIATLLRTKDLSVVAT